MFLNSLCCFAEKQYFTVVLCLDSVLGSTNIRFVALDKLLYSSESLFSHLKIEMIMGHIMGMLWGVNEIII